MKVKVDQADLNTLLGVPNRQFCIPPYQRPYAWEPDQVDELWGDLIETLGAGHFMGSIVITEDDKARPEVIDGQQRLATLLMLLSLIRDEYGRLKPEWVGKIQQYFENPYAASDLRFKLRSGDANWPVFRDFVLRSPSDSERRSWDSFSTLSRADRQRNARLADNAARLAQHLNIHLANCAHAPQRLASLELLERAIMTELEFVQITVPDVADAFIIFETLNDRGLALSAGDLLKNHLLARAGGVSGDVEDMADDWDELLASLNGADVTRFLRHYLLIRNARVLKDDVFPLFKKEVARKGPTTLMTELQTMGGHYGQFVDPSTAESKAVIAVLQDLNTLRAMACYSALLAARQWIKDDGQFVEFARLLEILTFRYSTICSKDSKELERVYQRSAACFAETAGTDLQHARTLIMTMMPGRDEFLVAFRRQTMGQQYIVNYVFRKLEASLDPEEKETKQPGHVHIEHIMPQTLNSEWKAALGERVVEHKAFVNRWGNLTLLGGRKNRDASNRSFTSKRDIYAKSNIHLTQRLMSYSQWGIPEIEARQEELADMAEKLWRVNLKVGRELRYTQQEEVRS